MDIILLSRSISAGERASNSPSRIPVQYRTSKHSIKFHSSDYLDALEMGMKPQGGSQYWVCPIIVEYMNDRFDKKLLQYIQNNEGNGMQFMAEYYNQNKG